LYDQSDPRAALSTASGTASAGRGAAGFAPAQFGLFDRLAPAESSKDARCWYLRGQNFVLNYIEAQAGACFARHAQPDEYALIVPDAEMALAVDTGDESVEVSGGSVVFVPPGYSVVRSKAAGRIVRLVTSRSTDMMAKALNAEAYRDARPEIPPFEAWPPAADGPRIRVYPLVVAPEPGRFGTIYRCSTFMINAIDPLEGPRDATRLSPHHHDDFEQCSLAVEGSFVHYLRWPWTTNLEHWREDEHALCGSPSAVVIPPPAIHTSRAVGEGLNRLVDIFSPPRLDFSQRPGWVLNAGDYPMPRTPAM